MLPDGFEIKGNSTDCTFSHTLPVDEADAHSLVFIGPQRKDKQQLLDTTRARVVLCDATLEIPESMLAAKCFVLVDNPKLVYTRILNQFFAPESKFPPGIHPTAIVSPEAVIHPSVHIGPFCSIGACIIHEQVIITSHVVIHDKVEIGRKAIVHEFCNIGCEGFGFVKNETGIWEKMRHIGRTIIGEDVELYPYVNVDKATLGDTVIKKGTKVDHYAHIGHNCHVGENCIITAQVVFCGGSSVGNSCWIGVGSVIKEKVKIGNGVTVGLGSVVTKNIDDNQTWMGIPAIPSDEFKLQQSTLRKLKDHER